MTAAPQQNVFPLLTVKDAEKRLNVSRQIIYDLRKEGKLSAVLLKGCIRFTEQEIERFINASKEA